MAHEQLSLEKLKGARRTVVSLGPVAISPVRQPPTTSLTSFTLPAQRASLRVSW